MEIKPEFGYVAGVVALSSVVHHMYMPSFVMSARKKFGVSYPDLYATPENCPNKENRQTFNCVQRGHQNSLENQPVFLALLLAAGLKHPVTAAVSGAIYLVGSVLYFRGYSTGNPDKRMWGAVKYPGLFTLLGICLKWGWTALASKA